MNPQNPMTNNNRSEQPYSPTPIIGHKSWSERFSVKKMLPNLIIGAILINTIPRIVNLLYPPYSTHASFVQNSLNIVFIILFLIIIIAQIKDAGNAKN